MKPFSILASLLFASQAIAQIPYDYRFMEWTAAGTGVTTQWISPPAGGANAIFMIEGNVSGYPTPKLATFDSTIVYNSGTKQFSVTGFATTAQGALADTALQPAGNGSSLTGLTQSQISGLVTALSGKFPNPSGTTAQYLRGDGTVSTFPSIPAAQVNSDWNAVSGVSQILNKPTLTNGTVTSAGLSSTDFSISGSPITTSGSVTANLGTVGTAGTYSGVTTDSKGRVTAGTARSFNNAATKTLVTSPTGQGGVVLDASRDVAVTYSISTSTTATIGGASSATVYLEIATTNSATAGDWTAIQTASNSQTITLAVILQSIQQNTLTVSGIVPAGYYVRLRYAIVGTASSAYVGGQEAKL